LKRRIAGGRLHFDALHPDDALLPEQDRPAGFFLRAGVETLQRLLYFLLLQSVAQPHPVAGLPDAENCKIL